MCGEDLKEIWKLMCRIPTKEFWLRPSAPHIGRVFWIMFVISICTFLGGFSLNIRALCRYAESADWWYFSILLAAIVLPQVPINLFSFWWWRTDSEDRMVSRRVTLAHCFLLALPLRMYGLGRQGRRAGSGEAVEYHRFYLAQADLSFLRLVNVYAGSGCQLVVRIYKLMENWDSRDSMKWEIVFACLTMGSLAFSTISHCRACRSHRYDKQELSYVSVLLQVLYRICFLASRVVALACLFYLSKVHALIACSCFLAIFGIWFHCMETDFTENPKQERFYHALMAFIHIFGMFNIKDTPAKHRYAFYYSLSLICETLIFTVFVSSDNGMYWPVLFPIAFFAGLVCHGIEHQFFHPGGRLYLPRDQDEWEHECEECERQRENDDTPGSAAAV